MIDRLNAALTTALSDPALIERIERDGAVVQGSKPEQLHMLVRSELDKWKAVVEQSRLKDPSAFFDNALELEAATSGFAESQPFTRSG